MGPDAEEGLAHDDKRRDVEDEVRHQIVEIQAVVKHEPPDKWMERKAQSAEEVGEEDDPLMRPRGRDELPLVGQPMRNIVGKVSGAAQLGDVLLLSGGGQPFASRSGHIRRRSRRDARAWALELEFVGMDKQRRKKA